MTTIISEVARYVQRHEGEVISNQDIAEALGILQSTASSSMHTLMEKLPIRKIAKGVYVYEQTKRELIETALKSNPGPMTIEQIVKASGLTRDQVGGNISHLVKNPESPVVRIAPATYQYAPEKTKQEEFKLTPTDVPEELVGRARMEKSILFEEIDALDDGTLLIQAEDGRIFTARETETEPARVVRFGNRVHIIR